MFQKLIPSTLSRAILAVFLFIAGVLPSQAQYSQSGDFTYSASATEVTITGYTGTGGAVTIPSSIEGLPVTSIGRSAFSPGYQGNQSIYSMTIPNSVTSIESEAFQGCTGLTSVTIPNSVISIGTYAFYGCTGLTSVTIPNSVISIADGTFYGCRELTNVTIPNSVTSIGSNAFSECTGLTSVTIPDRVTSIGSQAFWGCTRLTSVTIGSGSIESQAFWGCTGLTSMTIGSGVTYIGRDVFQYCYRLISIYFQGNAPGADQSTFTDTYPIIYYYAGKTGWESTYVGRPTVQVGAAISSQPVSVTKLQGTSAIFTVTASGATSYQWQKNSVNIPLATTATLTLKNVQSTDTAGYTVIVSNPDGYVTSDTANLTVLPDSDLDGLSDAAEASNGTNPYNADSDGDGLSDRAEIQVHLTNALVKDTDSDGFEDGFEVSTGFNPAQASSSPDSVSTIGNAVGFRFNAGLGLSYRIEDSTDLQNWNTLESPIIGAGGAVTRFYFTDGLPKRYFRVKKN